MGVFIHIGRWGPFTVGAVVVGLDQHGLAPKVQIGVKDWCLVAAGASTSAMSARLPRPGSGGLSRSGRGGRSSPAPVAAVPSGAGAPATTLDEEVASLSRPAEDYLSKLGVTNQLNDVVALLLENRPTEPLAFIADYFTGVVDGSSGLMKSYRYVRRSRHTCMSFMDNLYAGYLAANTHGEGLTAEAYARLLRALCRDVPAHIVPYVFSVLQKPTSETLSFPEFACGVHACLLYEEFFALARDVFHDLAAETGHRWESGGDAAFAKVAVPLDRVADHLRFLVHRLAAGGHRSPQLDVVVQQLSDGLALGSGRAASGKVTFHDFQAAVYRLSLPERPELEAASRAAPAGRSAPDVAEAGAGGGAVTGGRAGGGASPAAFGRYRDDGGASSASKPSSTRGRRR